MTTLLRGRGVFERDPFVLLDIGCSGGIDAAWRAFGPTLVAHGYDPDIDACAAAQAAEAYDRVRYHVAFVGLPDTHPFVVQRNAMSGRWPDTNFWPRSTSGALMSRSAPPPQRAVADPSRRLGVDTIVRNENLDTVDFIKIDVDGADFEVLESARRVLEDNRVLGVGMEVNWFGSANPFEHTFHNTDRFLREAGFALFGLTVRPYSRADLPSPFLYEFFAQTRFGQPLQGDAIYARDLAAPYEDDTAAEWPTPKLLKLACIYELAGLRDCAAEVVNRFRYRIAEVAEPDELLDALTPPLLGDQLTYREYLERFAESPELFLPSADARREAPGATAPGPREEWTAELEAAKRDEWLRQFLEVRGSLSTRAARRVRRLLGAG